MSWPTGPTTTWGLSGIEYTRFENGAWLHMVYGDGFFGDQSTCMIKHDKGGDSMVYWSSIVCNASEGMRVLDLWAWLIL